MMTVPAGMIAVRLLVRLVFRGRLCPVLVSWRSVSAICAGRSANETLPHGLALFRAEVGEAASSISALRATGASIARLAVGLVVG